MTEEQIKEKADYLKEMLDSPGGLLLFAHIDQEIADGWNKFIDMPVDSKTSKAAFTAQARYIVLKGIKEWVESEIKLGE